MKGSQVRGVPSYEGSQGEISHYIMVTGRKANKSYLTEKKVKKVEQKHRMSMPLRGC